MHGQVSCHTGDKVTFISAGYPLLLAKSVEKQTTIILIISVIKIKYLLNKIITLLYRIGRGNPALAPRMGAVACARQGIAQLNSKSASQRVLREADTEVRHYGRIGYQLSTIFNTLMANCW